MYIYIYIYIYIYKTIHIKYNISILMIFEMIDQSRMYLEYSCDVL